MTYFLNARRLEELDSSILGAAVSYELSPKYNLAFSQGYDFAQTTNINSAIEFRRRFDTFFVSFTYSYSLVDEESGFAINIYPTWWAFRGLDQTAFSNALRGKQTRR